MKFLEKIIEYGIYLFIFLLPVQTRLIIKAGAINGGYTEYSTISLYGTDILIILLLVLLVFYKPISRFKITRLNYENYDLPASPERQPASTLSLRRGEGGEGRGNYRILWFLIFGLWLVSLISVFFATDKALADFSLIRLTIGIGLFYLLTHSGINKLKLIWSFLFSIFPQSILSIWQFIYQTSFSSKWLGLALHQASDLGATVIESGGERWLRAYGGLDHPNILGGFISVGILMAIFLLLRMDKNIFFKRLKDKNEKIKIIIIWTMVIIFFNALIFSFSRSAWLSLALGILTMLIIAAVKKDYLGERKILEVIFVLGIIFFIFFNIYNNLFQTRILAEGRLENKSLNERVMSIETFKKIVKNNLIFGNGIGNYTRAEEKLFNNLSGYLYQPVHNTLLLVMSEIGIFGLIFYLFIILFSLLKDHIFNTQKSKNINNKNVNYLEKNRTENSNKFFEKRYLETPIVISIIIMMMFDHWFWSLHFGVIYFWLIICFLGLEFKDNLNNKS